MKWQVTVFWAGLMQRMLVAPVERHVAEKLVAVYRAGGLSAELEPVAA